MQVFECSETGNNRYNLAALYTQKAAQFGQCLTSEERKLTEKSFQEAIRMYKTHEENESKKIRNIIRTSNRLICLYLGASRDQFPDMKYGNIETISVFLCLLCFKTINNLYLLNPSELLSLHSLETTPKTRLGLFQA